ncbi:hypothetical protein ACHAWX_006534 [Stephanocyclus meneghinianus]
MLSNNNKPSGTASRRDSKSKPSGLNNNANFPPGSNLQTMGMNFPPNAMNIMPAGMGMMNMNMGAGFMQNRMGSMTMPMNQAMMNMQQQKQQQQQAGLDPSIGHLPFVTKQQQQQQQQQHFQQQQQQQQQQFQQQLQGLMGTNPNMANINMAAFNPLTQPQPSQNNQRLNFMSLLAPQQVGNDVPQTGTQQQQQQQQPQSLMQSSQMQPNPMQQTLMQQSQQLQQQPQAQMHQTQMKQTQMQQTQMQQAQMQQSQMQQSQMQQTLMQQTQMPQTLMHQTPMPQSLMHQTQMHHTQMQQTLMPQSQMPQSQMPQSQMPQSQMPQSQMQQSQMPQSQMQQTSMQQSQQHQQGLQAQLLQHQQQLLQLNLQKHQNVFQQNQSNSQNNLNALPQSSSSLLRWNSNASGGGGNSQLPATSPARHLQSAAAQGQTHTSQTQTGQQNQQQGPQANKQGMRIESNRPPSALQNFASRSVSNASIGQQHNNSQRRPSSNVSLGGPIMSNNNQQGNNQSQPSFNNLLQAPPGAIQNQLFLQQQLQLQQMQNLQAPSTRNASFSSASGPSSLQQSNQLSQNMQHQARRNSSTSVSSVGQKEQGGQSQSRRPSSQSQAASGSFMTMPNQQFIFQQQFPQMQNLQSLATRSVSIGLQSQNLPSSNVSQGVMQSHKVDQSQATTGASLQLPNQVFPHQQTQQFHNMLNQSQTPSGASASPLQQTGQNQSRRPSSQLHAQSGDASIQMTNQQLFLQQQMQKFQNMQKQSQPPSSASALSPQKPQSQIPSRRPSSGVSVTDPPTPSQQWFLEQQFQKIQTEQKQSQPFPSTSSSPAQRVSRPSSSQPQTSSGTPAQMFFLQQQQQFQQMPNIKGAKPQQSGQYIPHDMQPQTNLQTNNQSGNKMSQTINDSVPTQSIAGGVNRKESSGNLSRSTSTGQKRSESVGPKERRVSYSLHTQDFAKQGAAESSTEAPDGMGPTAAEPPTEEHQHQQVQAQAWFLFQQASATPAEDGQNKSDASGASIQKLPNEALKLSEQNEALKKMQEQFKQQEAIATLQQRQRGANEDELPLPLLSSKDTFQQRRQSWSHSDQHSQQGQNQAQQSSLNKTSADGNLPQSSSVPNEHNLQQPASAMQLQSLGLQSLASMQPQTKLVRQEKFQSSSSTPILGGNVRIQNHNNNEQQEQANIGMPSHAQPQQLQIQQDAMQQRLQLQNQAEFAKLQEIQQRMNQQYQRRPSQGMQQQQQIQRETLQLADGAKLHEIPRLDRRQSSTPQQQQHQNKQDLLRQQMQMQFEFVKLQKQKRLQEQNQCRPSQPEQQLQQDYLQQQLQNQADFSTLRDEQLQRRPSQTQQQQIHQDALQQQLRIQEQYAKLQDNQHANQIPLPFNMSQQLASQDDAVLYDHKRRKSSQSPSQQQQRPSLMQQQQQYPNQQLINQQLMMQNQHQQQLQQGNSWSIGNVQNQQIQQLQQMMMQKSTGGVNAQTNFVTAKNIQTPTPHPQLPNQNLMVPIQNFHNDQQRLSMTSPPSNLHTISNNPADLLNFYNPISRAKSSKRRSSGESVEESKKSSAILPSFEPTLGRAKNFDSMHPHQTQRAVIAASRASLQQTSQIATSSLTAAPFDENKDKKTEISSEDNAPSNSLGDTKTPSTETSKAGHSSREHHYTPQHVSSLTNEEVLEIATKLPVAERIVFSAKQLLGTGKNGFSRSTSAMQRLKRQRARQVGAAGGDEDDEHLKKKTFNARLAKKLHSEMKQGLLFCNMMTAVLKSIITEIDPDNPLLSIPMPAVFDPDSNETSGDETAKPKDGTTSASSASHSEYPQPMQNPSKNPPSAEAARSLGLGLNDKAETFAEGNPNGSTLRKRDSHGDDTPDPTLLRMISDDGGKKLTKKEIGYRLFESTRYRTLEPGDFVAAKVSSQDLWILARVVKEWISPGLSYKQMKDMSEIKRDAILSEKVYIQDHDEYNGDLKSARAVSRLDILPLPKSVPEANNWGSRARKGSRVYAMYPSTTALYPATVINNTAYCRNEDDILVVEFDGDEDELGVIPQRHIPARFVTLMPRESPSFKKRRRSVTSGGGGKKRGSKIIPSPSLGPSPSQFSDTSVDRMLFEMLK